MAHKDITLPRLLPTAVALIVALLVPWRAGAQWTTQDIPLVPGWNGVQLRVQPAEAECAAIFSNTPVEKVFWWQRTGTGMEFDLDPHNPFPRTADWQYWFTGNPAISTFASLLAGESYEIRVATNAAPFVLHVRGNPVLNPIRWIPWEANLVGLPVSTNMQVSFRDFFCFSPDFVMNPSTATVFRVTGMSNTADRVWNPATAFIRSGEACWISAGSNARDYGGPILVETETSSRLLDFGSSVSPRTLIVKNLTSTNRTIQITHLASDTPPVLPGISALLGKTPLLFKVASSDGSYLPLPDVLETNISGLGQLELSLAPVPRALTNGTPGPAWQGIIRVRDGNNPQFANSTVDVPVGVSCDGSICSLLDPQGLWVGRVTVTDVERAPTQDGVLNPWSGDGPVPVSRPFTFRVIFHVDSAGTTRLLQRALLAWQPTTDTVDPLSDTPTNGIMAILTDEADAKAYATLHPDAKIVRVSSACFPLMAPISAKTGSVFSAFGSLAVDVTVPYNDPVNPFVHRYHPQHDNLRYDNGVATNLAEGIESYTVTRSMDFHFEPLDPDRGATNRQWGVTENGGRFEETVTGLNKTIHAAGTFRVERVSRIGELQE